MKTISLSILMLSIIFCFNTAWCIPNTEIIIPFNGGIQLFGPRDKVDYSYSKTLSTSGSVYRQICSNPTIRYNIGKIISTPLGNFNGNGNNLLLDSTVSGLKLAAYHSGRFFNTDMSPNISVGVKITPTVVYNGYIDDSYRKSYGMPVSVEARILRGAEPIQSGTVIPRQSLYLYTCYDTAGVAQETNTVVIDNVPININVTGCTPESKLYTINMDSIPLINISNASSSSLISTKQQTFTLKCDTNISVSYSVVDLNDKTNTTPISSLTSDSTASGVGYAVTTSDGSRLSFGPDGSAMGIPGQNKYFLRKTGNDFPYIFSHQLGFSYVRKPEEELKPGSAKSLIGITYSYQ